MTRVAGVFLCCIGMIFLIPFWLVVLSLVTLEDGSFPILRQKRIGKGQVPFWCYKIRTMRAGTQAVASHEVSAEKITRMGSFLRRSGLDELPQLINVIKGDMNLVGPRPCLPSQQRLIDAREAQNVHSVLPGITGLAQVQGVDMSEPERLALIDGDYVRRRSFWLDMRLIWATLPGKRGRDAARL